jgi:signal transduction histidine kinase
MSGAPVPLCHRPLAWARWRCLTVFVAVATLHAQATPLRAASAWSWFHAPLRALEQESQALDVRLAQLPALPNPQSNERAGYHSGWAADAESVRWVQVDLGREMPLDAVVVIPAFLGGSTAYGFPARFRVDISRDSEFAESTTLFDHTGHDYRQAMAPVYLPAEGQKGRYVRFTATRITSGIAPRHYFCLGELLVFSHGAVVSARCPVTSSKSSDTAPTWSKTNLVDGISALGLPVIPGSKATNGWHSAIHKTPDRQSWVQMDLGSIRPLDEIRFIPTHPADFPDRAGFGFPEWFRLEASDDENFLNPQLLFGAVTTPFPNPGDNPVPFPVQGHRARYVRMTATQLWPRGDDYVIAFSEMQVFSEGHNIAMADGVKVTASDDVFAPLWQREWLMDGLAANGRLVDWPAWLQQLSQRRELEGDQEDLKARTALALAIAQRHATWWGAALAAAVVGLVIVSSMRSRRARLREMETLRQRIARDLHDEVGSHLGSISLASELALRESPEEAHATLDEIHRMSRQAAESMRGIVWLVREGGEPTLDRLMQALRDSATTQLQGYAWDLHVPDHAPRLAASLDFHRHVFLFFKEAVHNVVRHAHATAVHLEVTWNQDRFQLLIEDNGRGFDPAVASTGSGMANLRHRAAALHGEVSISSHPGVTGSRVTLTVPLSSPAPSRP